MTNSRVSTTEETKTKLKDFANGLDATYDEAINYLLWVIAGKKDENPLLEGVRLREDFKASPHNKEGRKRSKSPDGE